jgi:hypothetical protein
MGEAKRRKKLDPNYGKPQNTALPDGVWEEKDYECYGERAAYFKDLDVHLNQGGAFEKGLPKHHQYRSVKESHLYLFIQNAINHEEESASYILSKVKSLSDLTKIPSDLLNLVDKSIMSKRKGDLNQAFKYYDQVFVHNQTWFMLWYGLAKLLCLFREYKMAFACIRICTFLYPKMWSGRQYRSDHNLSYHFDQIYGLAVVGEENEPYLKTLGRPLNTFRVANSKGKIKSSSPVGKIKVMKPEGLNSSTQESLKLKDQYIDFPVSPRKAWELNQRLKIDGLSWFYKEFMTQKNMLEPRLYLTEVILDVSPRISPKKINIEDQQFSIPVVCFHPQSNIVKVLGIQEDEVVLVSRFQHFGQIKQKALKPQFFGCVRLVKDIGLHYGFVWRRTWDQIDCNDDDENSLIVHCLRDPNNCTQGTVTTLVEKEELGISVNRILIKVSLSYLNEVNEQEWQEVFVYLLKNAEPYDERINSMITDNLGDGWLSVSWQEP